MAKSTTLSERHLVAVIWDDAHHSLDEYSQQEIDLNFHKASRETNYGLLLKNDEQGVTLASEEDPNGIFRHTFFIPRQMIIEIIDWGKPKRPRQKKQSLETAKAPEE